MDPTYQQPSDRDERYMQANMDRVRRKAKSVLRTIPDAVSEPQNPYNSPMAANPYTNQVG
jgi:hypothetical protein